MAEMILKRIGWLRLCLRKYRIIIDGIEVGKIKHRSIAHFQITAGRHWVKLKVDWLSSSHLRFSVEEGEKIFLECGSKKGSVSHLLWLKETNRIKPKTSNRSKYNGNEEKKNTSKKQSQDRKSDNHGSKGQLIDNTEEICDKCGAPMVVKKVRNASFLGCSKYPDCKNTKPLHLSIKCPVEGCDGDIVEKRTRRGKIFYGCGKYPECKFACWTRMVGSECKTCGAPSLIEEKNGESYSCERCKSTFSKNVVETGKESMIDESVIKQGEEEYRNKQENDFSLSTPHKIFLENSENPVFVFFNKESQYHDVDKFSDISDLIINYAMLSANQFDKESSYGANEDLVHYFFDLYLYMSFDLVYHNPDIASMICDGIHYKYYGKPYDNIISNQMQLLAEKERCFYVSFMTKLKEADYPRYMGMFASSCVSANGMAGATDVMMLSKLILSIVERFSPRLEKEITKLL
ncbi:type I DNA topoisomerase [Candidatus Latescibacterota bacterium]